MVERDGDVLTRVVENVRRATLEPHIVENVKYGTTVSTDELKSYAKLSGARIQARRRQPLARRMGSRWRTLSKIWIA